MSKEQFRPKLIEVTTLFDSDLAEYEYMQAQEAAKKASEAAAPATPEGDKENNE